MQHHAVLISSAPSVADALLIYGDTSGYEVVMFAETTLGIDEVRTLITAASIKPASGTHRLLVVTPNSITFEAQQALLKLMEEPPVTTLFLFITRSELSLLPTLQSRFMKLVQPNKITRTEAFTEFITLSLAERMELVAKKMSDKDNEWLREIQRGLAEKLSERDNKDEAVRSTLTQVFSLLGGRGSANKMLLEELALTLPRVVRK